MDINAINHAKIMYVSLHDLCGFISITCFIFIFLSIILISVKYFSYEDEYEISPKRGSKHIKRLSIFVIILLILFIPSLIIPFYYKSQLVVSVMSEEQISKLVGK